MRRVRQADRKGLDDDLAAREAMAHRQFPETRVLPVCWNPSDTAGAGAESPEARPYAAPSVLEELQAQRGALVGALGHVDRQIGMLHPHLKPPPAGTTTVTVVAMSGGKDSTAMALRLLETEPDAHYCVICTPTGNELPEMFDHWQNIAKLLGTDLIPLVAGSLISAIRAEKMIPNYRARWCTRKLKIEPYQAFLQDLCDRFERVISCVGIRADEPERESGDYSAVIGVESRFPLREWGWGLREVLDYLQRKDVEIPQRTDCALCFFQRLGEWWDLWKFNPQHFAEGERIEAELGHTFRSDGRDTWPASLAGLRERFERGDVPRGASVQGELFKDMQCRVCRL